MPQVNYAEDIVPLSSFRSDMTRLMSQTRQTHRPIVVTQNGRAVNVFLDVGDYQRLIDKLDLMMDIYKGELDVFIQPMMSAAPLPQTLEFPSNGNGNRGSPLS